MNREDHPVKLIKIEVPGEHVPSQIETQVGKQFVTGIGDSLNNLKRSSLLGI